MGERCSHKVTSTKVNNFCSYPLNSVVVVMCDSTMIMSNASLARIFDEHGKRIWWNFPIRFTLVILYIIWIKLTRMEVFSTTWCYLGEDGGITFSYASIFFRFSLGTEIYYYFIIFMPLLKKCFSIRCFHDTNITRNCWFTLSFHNFSFAWRIVLLSFIKLLLSIKTANTKLHEFSVRH